MVVESVEGKVEARRQIVAGPRKMCGLERSHPINSSSSFIKHHIKSVASLKMSFYDEIEIEDMTYHEETTLYTYPCPCGDQFEISLGDLKDGEEVAVCPSCSLQIKVIFDVVGQHLQEFPSLPRG